MIYLYVPVVITLHRDSVSLCMEPLPGCPLPSAGPVQRGTMTDIMAQQGASVVQEAAKQSLAWRGVSGGGGLSCTHLAWIPGLMPWVGCESSCLGMRRSGWDHRKNWEPWPSTEASPSLLGRVPSSELASRISQRSVAEARGSGHSGLVPSFILHR